MSPRLGSVASHGTRRYVEDSLAGKDNEAIRDPGDVLNPLPITELLVNGLHRLLVCCGVRTQPHPDRLGHARKNPVKTARPPISSEG